MTEAEINKINDIIARPTGKILKVLLTDYNIPKWFLNRQWDIRDATYSQVNLRHLLTFLVDQ